MAGAGNGALTVVAQPKASTGVAVQIDAVSADTVRDYWSYTAAKTARLDFYIEPKTDNPGQLEAVYFVEDTTFNQAFTVRFDTNWNPLFTNAAGSAPGLLNFALDMAVDSRYRVSVVLTKATTPTTTNGTVNINIYADESDTPLETYTSSTVNLGTQPNWVRVQPFKCSVGSAMKAWIDTFRADISSTTTPISRLIQASSVNLTPASVSVVEVAVTPVIQQVTINLTPAVIDLDPRPLTPQSTTNVVDNFNSLTPGALLGAPWITHPSASGTFTAQTGGKVRQTDATNSVWTNPLIADFADGTIESDVTFVAGSGFTAGPIGRVSSSALTFYGARMNNSGALEMIKSVAGTVTSLGQYIVNLAAGATIKVGLRMSGSLIVVTGNGVDRITVTDTSITAAGRVGLRATGGSTTTTGLHIENFEATAATATAMPTVAPAGFVIDSFCDFSEGDVALGGFTNATSGDLGKLNPASPGGTLYASKWKTKSVGAVPNQTNSDYDASQSMEVVNGVLRMRQRYGTDGRGKAGAIKPLFSGSNPDGENYISYPWIQVRFRKSTVPASGSTAVGWGGIAIEAIGDATSWANGGGEIGVAEGEFTDDADGGSPLGVWVRPSNHLPNPNDYDHFERADAAGAPSGENDWHIGEIRSEPGRLRVYIDGVVIWEDTVYPPAATDLFGLLSQNGKTGTPAAGTEGVMEWDWYVVGRYVGATLSLPAKTVNVTPVAVSPVGQPGTVNLVPTVLTLAVPVNPNPDNYSDYYLVGAYPAAIGLVNLTSPVVTLTARSLPPLPGLSIISGNPPTITVTALAVSPVPDAVQLDEGLPVDLTLTPVPVNPVPQSVTLSLTPAVVSAVAAPLGAGAVGLVNLTPKSTPVTAVALSPTPGQASTSIAPALVLLTPFALTALPQLVTTSIGIASASVLGVAVVPAPSGLTTLTPKTATVTPVALAPTPGAVTINLAPASVGLTTVGLTTTLQPVQTSITPIFVSLAGVAVTPVTQPGAVTLAPKVVPAAAVALNPVPVSGQVNLSPAGAILTVEPTVPEPGAVSFFLLPISPALAPVAVTPVSISLVNLAPRVVPLTPVAVTPIPGAVTISLTPATVVVSAQIVGAQAKVDLAPATVTTGPVPTTQSVGSVTTLITAATASAVALPVTPVPQPVDVFIEPTVIGTEPPTVTPIALSVEMTLVPALVYVSPWAVTTIGPETLILTAAVAVLSPRPVIAVPGQMTTSIGIASATVTANAVDPVPQGSSVSLVTIAVAVLATSVGPVPQATQVALQAAIVSVAPGATGPVPGPVSVQLGTATMTLSTHASFGIELLPGIVFLQHALMSLFVEPTKPKQLQRDIDVVFEAEPRRYGFGAGYTLYDRSGRVVR
jgi:hypothetical protein